MKRIDRIVSPYNDVDVWQNDDGSIDFNVVGATHATWHPRRLLTGHAWDAISAATLLHPGTPRRILMLGLGGGTVLRQLRRFLPHAEFTSVEIDGEMIRLAREYMQIDDVGVEVILDDAYAWLETPHGPFDVIIDDLYRSGIGDVERPAAVTSDLLHKLCAHLAPDGTLVMNLVIGKGHRNTQRAARAAFLERFPSVRAVRPPLSINEVLCGTTAGMELRGPRSLYRMMGVLDDERDRKYWKELRTLKLR